MLMFFNVVTYTKHATMSYTAIQRFWSLYRKTISKMITIIIVITIYAACKCNAASIRGTAHVVDDVFI